MITIEADGGGQDGDTVATEADNQVVQVPGSDSDPNKAFLAQSEQNRITPAIASRNARPDALIAHGTLIRGFLETAINSDLPGMVRAVVRENVYSLDGRRILVPKGPRLVGEYKSGLSRGQKRVFVVWNRIVVSDGTQVDIASPGADNIGQAGLTGKVDMHWAERVGSAMFFSILGSGAQIGTALAPPCMSIKERTSPSSFAATSISRSYMAIYCRRSFEGYARVSQSRGALLRPPPDGIRRPQFTNDDHRKQARRASFAVARFSGPSSGAFTRAPLSRRP
nr:TrbI/VirB10 family protein [uncultured Rhizobium sp.]